MDDYVSVPGPSSLSPGSVQLPMTEPGTSSLTFDDDSYLQLLQNLLEKNLKISDSVREKRLECQCRLANEEECWNREDDPETNKRPTRSLISIFFKPYFRDKYGLRAPLPFDTSGFLVDQCLLPILLAPKHSRPWTETETEQLLKQVSSQYVHRFCSNLVQQLEELLEKQSENPDDSSKSEINRLNSELALARSRSDHPPDRWYPYLDWLMIAKFVESDDRDSTDCELYYNNQLHPSVNQGEWTSEEDARLIEIVSGFENNMGIWDLVARKLATGRLGWQCCSRFHSSLKAEIRPKGPIVGEEAKQILNTIEYFRSGDYVNWDNVKCLVEGRTIQQVKHFWNKLRKPVVMKKWSSLEDRVILAGYRLYGPRRWAKIASFLPNRTNKQVRQRYTNSLCFSEQRKFGHWTEPEDELIIEMAAKYIRPVDNQINFPEIRRIYFPNRSLSQLYRRYQYLKRVLPEEVFTEQSQENDNDDEHCQLPFGERPSSSAIFQNTITRKRFPATKADRNLIQFTLTDPKKIERFLFSSRRKLLNLPENLKSPPTATNRFNRNDGITTGATTTATIEEYDDEFEDAFNEIEPCSSGSTNVLTNVRKDEPHDEPTTISSHLDYDLALYAQLAYHSRRLNNRFSAQFNTIDEMANRMIGLFITETVDWQCQENQKLPRECFSSKASPLEEIAWKCSDFGVDTIRFFLSGTSCYVPAGESANDEDDGNTIEVAKAIYVPNQATMFGYAILKLMSNSLAFQLVDDDRNEDMEPDEMIEQEIVSEPAFAELSSIFNSLFLWPALLALKTGGTSASKEEDLKFRAKILEQSEQNRSEDCPSEADSAKPQTKSQQPTDEVVSVETVRGRGRPKKKRKFFQPLDRFVLTRSIQGQILFSHYNEKILRQIYEKISEENVENSERKFWIAEPRSSLVDRTRWFVQLVFDVIRESHEERINEKLQQLQQKPPITGNKRGRKPDSKNFNNQVEGEIERRQSSRTKRKTER